MSAGEHLGQGPWRLPEKVMSEYYFGDQVWAFVRAGIMQFCFLFLISFHPRAHISNT